ncbi:MAG: hypothetical protein H0V12_02070 [Chloroflexi bacterium]|nr:hypothetical protein [Chloroflexota bacterium]
MTARALILSSGDELPSRERIWGTGGWIPPEQREALDWLTLLRMLGWESSVAGSQAELEPASVNGLRWVILGCDPDSLAEDTVALLERWLLEEPILIVGRAPSRDAPLARLVGAARGPDPIAGGEIRWLGPGHGQAWQCRRPLEGTGLEVEGDAAVWATLAGRPLIAGRRVGRGAVAALGFHPSQARDTDGAATALLRQLLTSAAVGPVAWFDLEGSLVLRMDDPGGAQNVFSRSWSYPKLEEAAWRAIGADLAERKGRISLAYVAGWVDDGDPKRGVLKVSGSVPERAPGRIHPSPCVVYEDLAGHAPGTVHDYTSEFRGIQALRRAGLAEVELHGYTHLHPDRAAWAGAGDRYEAKGWYREFGHRAAAALASIPISEHPLALGIAALRRHFGVNLTTLVPPGDEWTNEVLASALDLGLQLVDSYYLAIRHQDRFCWTTHVCAPYLDLADSSWFDAGLPVVGYFHDREPALEGVGWLTEWLDRWQTAGARRLLDFRELASTVGRHLHVENRQGGMQLRITSDGAPRPVRPIPVSVRVPDGRLPSRLSVSFEGRDLSLEVEPLQREVGRVWLPLDSES